MAGAMLQRDAALAYAHQLIDEGADILDIGGESTRPGAQSVGIQEELDRVIPIIEGLCGASAPISPVPISIDTSKPEVMQAAIAAGARMVNDIDALQDAAAMNVVGRQ